MVWITQIKKVLPKSGPIYTKHQCQRRVNAAMTFATQLSSKSMESPQNELQPYSVVTLFVSIYFNESHVASIIAALTLH